MTIDLNKNNSIFESKKYDPKNTCPKYNQTKKLKNN